MAFLVTAEDGFDAEHRSHHGAGAAESTGAIQEHQIVHRKIFAQIIGGCDQLVRRLVHIFSRFPQVRCHQRQQTGTESRAAGVHGTHRPVREFVLQFLRSHHRCIVGAADAAGKAHIDHILTCLQSLAEMIHKELGVEQAGLDQLTFAQQIVMGRRIKRIDVAVVNMLNAVQRIGAGQHLNSVFSDLLTGEIGAAVGIDSKGHGCSS